MARDAFDAGIRARVRRMFRLVASEAHAQREIDDEIAAHIDARVEYLVERGMSPEGAREEAVRRFGDLERGRADLHEFAREQHRHLELRSRIDALRLDAAYVVRGLMRSPAFTLGVIGTFALGLGINSAVFRITDQVLLRPPAGVRAPHNIRRIETTVRIGTSGPIRGTAFSYPDALALMATGATMSFYSVPQQLAHTPDGRDVATMTVDSGYFHLLGTAPSIGRAFDAAETAPGAGIAVAILSYDYWRSTGAAALNDRSAVSFNNRTYRVVGVMPRGFTGIDMNPLDVWIPLGVGDLGRSAMNGVEIPWYRSEMGRPLHAIMRLPSEKSEDATLARMSAAIGGKDKIGSAPARDIALRPIMPAGDMAKDEPTVRVLQRLGGVAGLILLIACANAAHLLLARGLRRRQEIAVRLALGASRMRIARLLLVESITLGLMGGVAATIAGYWTGEALRHLLFPDARWNTVPLDRRSILFTLMITIVAGIAAGVSPAMQLTNPDLVSGLKDRPGGSGVRTRRTRAALVGMQTAFSLALLVASGLLVRSLQRLNAVELGFDASDLVTASLTSRAFDANASRPGGRNTAELADRLRHDPLVRSVALSTNAPFGEIARLGMSVPGTTFEPENDEAPMWSAVSDNFFAVMGTHVLRGRTFGSVDVRGGQPVAVINRTMAEKYWSGVVPAGGCILLYNLGCAVVVGTVEDIRETHGNGEAPMRYYLSLSQVEDSALTVIVRARENAASSVAAEIKTSIPRDARATILEVSDQVARGLRPWRIATMLFIALGGIALALACVGVYSVMSYIASERVHEMGVRMVLGANSMDVLMLVLRDGFRLVMIGGAVGLVASAAGARLLGSLLFDVSPMDPLVYTIGAISLAVMAIGATMVPALRASRVHPIEAIRTE